MRKEIRTKEQKYDYDKQYLIDNIVTVRMTLNKRKPEDMRMLEWINLQAEGKAGYIRRLILEDMKGSGI